MIVFLQILVAAAICIYGVILLVRLLKSMEKDLLESWLGFLKFFLGTFVIGLLGFFAKVSYENRQMAINEAAQIGNYVDQATSADMDKRIQFAEYFSTVLPEGHNTNWNNYFELLKQQKIAKKKLEQNVGTVLDSVEAEKTKPETLIDKDGKTVALSYLELLKKDEEELSQQEKDYIKKIDSIIQKQYDGINEKMQEIKEIDDAYGAVEEKENIKSTAVIDEFVTCREVKNLLPYGRSTEFNMGKKVYVHAYVKSSEKQQIQVIWKNGQEVLKSKFVDIGVNLGRGFRVFDHIKAFESGNNYSVELRDSNDNEIAFKKFIVK